jgi:uncharacterized protein (DUF58 family)
MELIGVRPYRPGDAMRDLHAITWARTGEPSVREYRQENFTRVGVVFDTDPAGASEKGFEAGVSLVAGIVARLCSGEELIDLLVTGDRARSFTPGRSLGRLDHALDHLADVLPGEFDAGVLMEIVKPSLTRLSSVVFVAFAWDEQRRALVTAIEQTGVGCRVVVVSDPRSRRRDASPVSRSGSLDVVRVAVDDVIAASHDGEDLVL